MNILKIEGYMIDTFIKKGLIKYTTDFLLKKNIIKYEDLNFLFLKYIEKNKHSILSKEYYSFTKKINSGNINYKLSPYFGDKKWNLKDRLYLTMILDLNTFYLEFFDILKGTVDIDILSALLKFNRFMIKEPFKTINLRNTNTVKQILKHLEYPSKFNCNHFIITPKEIYKSLENYAYEIFKNKIFLHDLNEIKER